MTIRLITALLICSSFLVSCSQDTATVSQSVTTSQFTEPRSLQTTVINSRTTFALDGVIFVPCALDGAGESVRFFGNVKAHMHLTDNGNTNILNFTAVLSESFAIGLSSGLEYQNVSVSVDRSTTSDTGYPMQFTTNARVRFIGPGPRNDLILVESLHVTVNADGTTTVEKGDSLVLCK
jgi:hypothetical protein